MSTQPRLRRICLLMAMQAEAQPIIDAYQLCEQPERLDTKLPMRCFEGDVGQLQLSLLVSGLDPRFQVDNIGSEAAALMAYQAVSRLQPQLLISAGTAGGFAARGAAVGTVYLSDAKFIYHDRHVPLPGFDQSAVGHYPAFPVDQMALDLGLPLGIVSSGSSLLKSPADLEVINQHQAVAKEMEAAAVAWVAMLYDLPMFAIKSITNILDQDNRSESEFAKNLATASANLQTTLARVLDYLQGKSLQQLTQG